MPAHVHREAVDRTNRRLDTMTTPTCPECEGSGWRDVKSPDDTAGYAPCSCTPRARTVTRHECGCTEYHETDKDGRTIATGIDFCTPHWDAVWEGYRT